MSASQHFLLSYAASLFLAISAAALTLLSEEWLKEAGVPTSITVMAAFLIVFKTVRFIFKNFIPAKCMYCHLNRAYTFQNRGDRFRCEQCGGDF